MSLVEVGLVVALGAVIQSPRAFPSGAPARFASRSKSSEDCSQKVLMGWARSGTFHSCSLSSDWRSVTRHTSCPGRWEMSSSHVLGRRGEQELVQSLPYQIMWVPGPGFFRSPPLCPGSLVLKFHYWWPVCDVEVFGGDESVWRCGCVSHLTVFDSLWPHGRQPITCLCPWNFPGENTEWPFPSPGDLPDPGGNAGIPHCRQFLYGLNNHGRNLMIWSELPWWLRW